jgi:hypothetical protein
VSFAFDEAPVVESKDCGRCGTEYRLVKAFVVKDRTAHAVVCSALHHNDGQREGWMDAILGAFGGGASADHVTFGCRVGPIEGQVEPAASVVQAAVPYSDSSIWGRKLDRTEALSHPWLPDFWEIVDFVLVNDEVVHDHVYGG